jgi:hypothetical protein
MYLVAQDYQRQKKIPAFVITKTAGGSVETKSASGFGDYIGRKTQAYLKQKKPYVLEGIVYDAQTPFAIINGRQLKKNQMIDHMRLIEIEAASVLLLDTNSNTTASLSLDF